LAAKLDAGRRAILKEKITKCDGLGLGLGLGLGFVGFSLGMGRLEGGVGGLELLCLVMFLMVLLIIRGLTCVCVCVLCVCMCVCVYMCVYMPQLGSASHYYPYNVTRIDPVPDSVETPAPSDSLNHLYLEESNRCHRQHA